MKSVRYLTLLAAAALPLFIALLGGCPKKETDGGSTSASATTAAAAPTPTPTTTTTPAPTTSASAATTADVDAGAGDAGKADADAGKATGGPAGGLAACCRSLEQNQRSAPLDQQGMYIAAIAACKSGGSVPAALRAAIPACK